MQKPTIHEILSEPVTSRIVCLTSPEHLDAVPELSKRAKIAEYRYDMPGMSLPEDELTETLEKISEHMPVLFTNRWSEEGGSQPMQESERIQVARIVSPFVAGMDSEIDAPATQEIFGVLKAVNPNATPLASSHDFIGITDPEDWMIKVFRGRKLASWLKVAVQIDNESSFHEFTRFMQQISRATQKVIAAGMGEEYGFRARVEAVRFRIAAIYCTPESSASLADVPGQPTLDQADQIWAELGITAEPGYAASLA